MSRYKKSDPKPPPKYRSRKVQVRLMLLVFMFMSVLVMMERARDPALYSWMGFEEPAGQGDEQVEDENLDTRLRLQPAAREHIAGLVSDTPPVDVEVVEGADVDLVGKILLDAWAKNVEHISRKDKWVLFRVLKHYRDGSKVSEEDIIQWSNVLPRLDVSWTKYVDEARSAVTAPESDMSEEEKADWTSLLDRIGSDWQDKVRPTMEKVFTKEPLTETEQLLMQRIQSQVDAVCIAKISDDKFFQGRESDAWFRLLDELQVRSLEDLEANIVGTPSYTGLFRQPDTYRAKLVKVRGTAKRVHRIDAPKNAFDIKEYYLFWIKPKAAKAPIAVYSLEIPEGFPVSSREEVDEYLSEEVEFTGFFFKRYAYRARDGANTVPQLLAKVPRWTPKQNFFGRIDTDQYGFFSQFPLTMLTSVLAVVALVCASVITFVAYRRSRWTNEAMVRAEGYSRSQVDLIEEATKGMPLKSVQEKLNDLAEEQ